MMYVCPFTESSLYKVVTMNYTRSFFGSAVVIVGCNKQQLPLLHFIYSKDYWIALRMRNVDQQSHTTWEEARSCDCGEHIEISCPDLPVEHVFECGKYITCKMMS